MSMFDFKVSMKHNKWLFLYTYPKEMSSRMKKIQNMLGRARFCTSNLLDHCISVKTPIVIFTLQNVRGSIYLLINLIYNKIPILHK